jgi:oligopeptide transport system substrate-binding protein
MKTRFRIYVGWLIATVLAACSTGPNPVTPAPDSASPTPEPTAEPEPIIVRIDLGLAPASIDPLRIGPQWASANDLVENLFSGLTRLDGDSAMIEPALAIGWETSADGLTWTFSLRDDIFWVNINPETGQAEKMRPITAADVVYTVRRVCRTDPKEAMVKAAFVIQGCREVNEHDPATLTDDIVVQTVGVRLLNDTTVEFKLVDQAAYFPTLLAMPLLYPVPSEVVEAGGEQWTTPGNVWTSGPFTVQPNIPPEEGYTLIMNSFWPLARTGNVEIVQISFTPEASTAFEAWESGGVALVTLPTDQLPNAPFDSDPAYRLLAQPITAFLVAHYDTPPMDNPDVRQALLLALDRQKIIDEVLEPAGQPGLPAASTIPPGSGGAPAYAGAAAGADPDAARAALADAGYRGCARLPQITLLAMESDLYKALGDYLVKTWAEVLGCPDGVFKTERMPGSDVQAVLARPSGTRQARRAGVVFLEWQADYPDSYHWLADIFGCRDVFPDAYLNQSRTCIEGDQALTQAASTLDPDLRATSYQKIEQAFFDPEGELPIIPLYHYARAIVVQPWIEVYPLHAGPLRFEQWTVDQSAAP